MIAARKAKERLDMVHAKVIGVVVNGMDENLFNNEYGTYYRYFDLPITLDGNHLLIVAQSYKYATDHNKFGFGRMLY